MEVFLAEGNARAATNYLTTHNNMCVFDILGLDIAFHEKSQVIRRWKQISLLVHPDKNPNELANVRNGIVVIYCRVCRTN